MAGFIAGQPAQAAPAGLCIAGVGASAGGLEAMLVMFAQIPLTGRIAYVVAQHMAHDGHSELVVRLIQRESTLPVVLADDGLGLQPDTVYVIPSGANARLRGTTLQLLPPSADYLSTPSVNALFISLAEQAGTRAIGIVLSGTGSDGTLGCRAIAAAGGLTLAQDLAEAKFNGMPAAAVEAGTIGQQLPVAAIGGWLAQRFPALDARTGRRAWPEGARVPVQGSPVTGGADGRDGAEGAAQRLLERLFPQILAATGIDFSSYKEDTLLRRVEKRMAMLGIDSAEAYLASIARAPEELKHLQHLFLVSVSSFFRDAESFAVLTTALAGLLTSRPSGQPVRVWVPGCASGEEPWTLAIVLSECLQESGRSARIEIIATDLNPEALALAHAGVYRLSAFKEMPPVLRERYFSARGQHLEVAPGLRTAVRFEQRDVLSGPPPGLFDLVSCRNLLIYMKSALQDQLINSFHQALQPHGLLFIGQSESLSFVGNGLFSPIDHYHRLFRRRH